MNKFYLFLGLAATIEGEVKGLNEREQEVIEVFTCDPRWPICAYDFVFKNRIPSYTALRVEAQLESFRIDDYFSFENLNKRPPRKNFHKIT